MFAGINAGTNSKHTHIHTHTRARARAYMHTLTHSHSHTHARVRGRAHSNTRARRERVTETLLDQLDLHNLRRNIDLNNREPARPLYCRILFSILRFTTSRRTPCHAAESLPIGRATRMFKFAHVSSGQISCITSISSVCGQILRKTRTLANGEA